MVKNPTSQDNMTTLSTSMNKLVLQGFTETFSVTDKGLIALSNGKQYSPDNIEVENFFRFEGASDPGDNAILYAIKTNDGLKGTLTDAYGPYADANISKFMKQVEDITKKIN
jgi:hypothetical protein